MIGVQMVTQAAITQGAIAGDKLLDKVSFKQWFQDRADKAYFDGACLALTTILSYKGSKSYDKAFQAWRQFERTFLGNNIPTALMVIANFTGDQAQLMQSGSTTISQRMDITSSLTPSGMVRNAGMEMLGQAATQILMSHYNNLMQTVQYGQITSDPETFRQIEEDRYNVQYEKMRTAIKYRLFWNDNPDKSYRQVIYGGMYDAQFRGQVADAFINHLGAMHQSLFANGGLSVSPLLKASFAHSVRYEEGSHFLQLLVDSRNNTNWLSGGDLNIVDSDMSVVARIQLKTVKSSDISSFGKLSHHTFFKLIENLKKALDNYDIDQYAELLYKKLTASAFMTKLEKDVSSVGVNMFNSLK